MRVMAASALAWCLALALGAVSAQPAAEGVPLFNGRDLTGWHNINCAPGTFSVRDGEIYSTGAPICEIRTERMYENFVLDVEWMHLTPKGNAGVFIWSDALPARGQPFLKAVEIQVLDGRETDNYTSHGDIFPIHGARMTPDRPHPNGWSRSLPSEKRARPAGQWNHYRITADRGRVTLEVNGKAVSGGSDISPRKGYIALEAEGAPVRFRNLRIRELPPDPSLTTADTNTPDPGFRSIYTGVDLSGWVATGTSFRPADWQIAASGPGGSSLRTERTFRVDSVLIDWRCGPPQENEQPMPKDVTTRGGFTLQVAGIDDPRLAQSCADTGSEASWHRLQARVLDGKLSVIKDGEVQPGSDPAVPDTPAPIVVTHHGGAVTFANVFVREKP